MLLDGTAKVGTQKLVSAKAAQAKIVQSHRTLVFVLASAVGGSVLVCLGLLIVIPASITKPMAMLSAAAASMSAGNLQQAVPTMTGARDFAGLAEALERMRISLKLMMERFAPSAR